MNFARRRMLFYVISAAMLVPGVISLLLPGGLRPSIDFTSGTLMTLRFVNADETSDLRETRAALGQPEAIVQRSGEGDFIVRTAPLAQPGAGEDLASGRQRLESGLLEDHGPVEILNLDQVSPLIAAEIVQNSIVAVGAASLA